MGLFPGRGLPRGVGIWATRLHFHRLSGTELCWEKIGKGHGLTPMSVKSIFPPKSHCNNIFSMKNRKQKKPLDSRNSLPQSVILDITKCYPGRSCLYVRDSCKAVVLRVWTQDPQIEHLLRPSQTCTLVGPIPGLPN